MKLHLPCNLLAALLACFCAVGTYTLGAESISINFGSDEASISNTNTAGIEDVAGKYWNQFSANSDTDKALRINDGTENGSTSTATVSWTSSTIWRNGTSLTNANGDTQLLKGYLDDGGNNGATIDVSGLDFMIYDLYIYANTDTGGGVYTAKTVNGVSYTYKDSQTTTGTETWGNADVDDTEASEGTNALHISGLQSTNLSIVGGARSNSTRGGISGIQIVDTTASVLWTSSAEGSLNAETSNFTLGSTNNKTLADICALADGRRYIGLDGQTLELNSSHTLDGVQSTTGTSTITGEELHIDMLYAKHNATLVLDGTLAQNSALTVGGQGTVQFSAGQSLDNLTIDGNLHIADNVKVVVSETFTHNAGTITGGTGASLYRSLESGVAYTQGEMTITATEAEVSSDLIGISVGETKLKVGANAALVVSSAGGTLTVTGAAATLSSLTLSGGTTVLRSADEGSLVGTLAGTLGGGQLHDKNLTLGNGVSLTSDSIDLGTSTLTLEAGSSITATSIIASNGNAGRTSNININGGTLVIMGDVTSSTRVGAGSVRLAHWDGVTKLTLESGEFRALNAAVGMGDDGRAIVAINGGIMNVLGFGSVGNNAWGTRTSELHLNDGILNIGSHGITDTKDDNGVLSISLAGGTLGVLDSDWTSELAMSVGNLTINTTKYNAETKQYSTTEGATITLSGSLTAEEDSTLTVSGLGTLKITGIDTLNRVAISSGATLAITTTQGTTADFSSVSLVSGSTLSLTLAGVADGSYEDGTTLTLDDAAAGTLEVASGKLNYGSSLSNATVRLNGSGTDKSGIFFQTYTNGTEQTFSNTVEIAEGKTGYIVTWGNSANSANNVLTKLTGAGTLVKKDGGTLTIEDLSEFTGSLQVDAKDQSGSLILDSAATLSSLTVNANATLYVNENSSAATYTDGSTGKLVVAEGKTLTLTVPSGTDNNATEQAAYGYWDAQARVWNIFSSSAVDANGNVLSKGYVKLDGDAGHDGGAGSSKTVLGNYIVTRNYHSQNGSYALTVSIGGGSSLYVMGDALLENKQYFTVGGRFDEESGALLSEGRFAVQGTLTLGHTEHGNEHYSNLTINEGAVVTLGGLTLNNNNAENYVKLAGGRLNLGSGAFTYYTGSTAESKPKHLVLDSGTMGTTSDTWNYGVATEVGNVTFDTTQQVLDTATGLTTPGTTGATMTMEQNVTLTGDEGIRVTGRGELRLHGDITGYKGIEVDGAGVNGETSLRLGGGRKSDKLLNTGDITVNQGTLMLWHATSSVLAWDDEAQTERLAKLTLANGSALHVEDVATPTNYQATGTIAWGKLVSSTTDADSEAGNTINFNWKGYLSFDSLTGNANLSIAADGQSQLGGNDNAGSGAKNRRVTFGTLENYSGTLTNALSVSDSHKLYVNGVMQSATHSASVAGKSWSADGFVMGSADGTATGSVHFADHTAEGSFTLKSGTMTADSLSLAAASALTQEGGTLKVSSLNLAAASALTQEGGTMKVSSLNLEAASSLRLEGGTLGLSSLNLADDAVVDLEGGIFGTNADFTSSHTMTLGSVTLGTEDYMNAISLTGTTKFNGTVTNKVALTLSGSLEVMDLTALQHSDDGYTDAAGNFALQGHGFASGTYWLVKGDETLTTDSLSLGVDENGTALTQKTITVDGYGEQLLTLNGDSASFALSNSTVYHVNALQEDSAVAYSTIAATGKATGISLNGGTLTVTNNEAAALAIYVTADSTIIGSAGVAGQTHGGIAGNITAMGDGGDLVIQTTAATASGNGVHGNYFTLGHNGANSSSTGCTVDMGSEHSLILRGGVVRVGSTTEGTVPTVNITAKDIVVEKDATLELFLKADSTMNTGVRLQGGTINMQLIEGDGTLQFGALTVESVADATAELKGMAYQNGVLGFSSLTGAGNLNITGGRTTITEARDYTGTLSVSGGATTISGGTLSGDVSYTGGTLTLGTVSFAGGTFTVGTGKILTATTLTISEDSTLKLNASDVNIDASLITIANGKTLTLSGSGTYDVQSAATIQAQADKLAADATTWTGTVKLTGDGSTQSNAWLNLNNYGVEGSKLELQGVVGYLTAGQTVTADVTFNNLEDGSNALTIHNGSSNSKTTFSGKVSGKGTLERNTTIGKLSYDFTGDVSEWGGTFKVTAAGGNTEVTFNNAADKDTSVKVALHNELTDKSLSVTFEDSNKLAVQSAITGNTNVAYKGTGQKTVSNTASDYSGTTTVEGGEVVVQSGVQLGSGEVTVKGAGSLTLDSGATVRSTVNVKQADNNTVATLSGRNESYATYADLTISSEGLSGGSLSNASVAVAKAFAIEGVSVTNCDFDLSAALTVGEGTAFDAATTVSIGAAGALLNTGIAGLELGTGNTLILGMADVTGTQATFTIDDTNKLLTITSQQLQNVVSGSFTVDMAGSSAEVATALENKYSIKFVFTAPETAETASLVQPLADEPLLYSEPSSMLTFTLGSTFGSNYGPQSFSIAHNADGSYTTETVHAIPEPTTATLSLLALAALAARRRRK